MTNDGFQMSVQDEKMSIAMFRKKMIFGTKSELSPERNEFPFLDRCRVWYVVCLSKQLRPRE